MKISAIMPAGMAILVTSQAFAANIDVLAFSDTFDVLHTNGATVYGKPSEVGNGWVGQGGLSTLSIASNEQGNGGLSMKQTRGASNFTYVRGMSDSTEGVSQANRTYTLKFDIYATEPSVQQTVLGIFTGLGFDFDHTLFVGGGTWRYWDPAQGQYVNTGVANGALAWNNVELEVRNGPITGQFNGNDVFTAELELFLTRPAENSAGVLPRTSIATWTQENIAVGSLYRLDFNVQANSTFYYDNVNFGYSIPEPGVVGLFGMLFVGFARQRRGPIRC